METLKEKVKWQVSLSNGETFFEGKGKFISVSGELSPWQKLGQYLKDNNLSITSLGLYTDFGQHFNLPAMGNNPKFKEFKDILIPSEYKMHRKLSGEMVKGRTVIKDWFTVIEAIYPDYKLQIWVDEKNIKNLWSLIIKN